MSAVVNFFEGIGAVIISVVNFVISLFEDLVWVIQSVGWAISIIPDLLFWVPSKILAIILATLSVVMIYKIMGREG